MTRPSMIRRSASALSVLALAVFGTAVAQAQPDDIVRGTVVDVDVDNDRGTITVEDRRTGERETFEVTPDTEIDFETADNPRYALTSRDDIRQLRRGDTVRLKFSDNADGSRSVSRYQREEPNTGAVDVQQSNRNPDSRQSAGRSADASYSTLPSTATNLPLIALLGTASLLLAGALQLAGRARAKARRFH